VTALRRSDLELGREAARLLLQALNGEIAAAAVRLPVELVVRRSCGCRS
jgi:DNA-binding LacI/PurR family transcriptional regulator